MFVLPKLPYEYNALEPFIDEETMRIHHDKHHQTYVDKLNLTLEKYPSLLEKNIEELLSNNLVIVPDEIKQAVANHGGGHFNHSFFWEIMSPNSKSKIPESGKFFEAVIKTFGSFAELKTRFSEKAMSVFGSGWAFLIKLPDGTLKLKRHSFQNSPVMFGNIPILAVDVWEHAYYLKYQNRRNEYVDAFWNIINWKKVEENFSK
jgi:superoxide dismutase, Fe-Mn family